MNFGFFFFFSSSFRLLLACARVLSCFSFMQLLATLRIIAHKVPWPIGFSRQEYCSGLPYSPPGDLPNPEIKSASLTSPASTGGFFTTGATVIVIVTTKPPHLSLMSAVLSTFLTLELHCFLAFCQTFPSLSR